jgi:hypothetical protein
VAQDAPGREATVSLPDDHPHTEIDATELGTQAASPKALADAAAADTATGLGLARPSAWGTASNNRTPHPTAAEALDKSDLARS